MKLRLSLIALWGIGFTTSILALPTSNINKDLHSISLHKRNFLNSISNAIEDVGHGVAEVVGGVGNGAKEFVEGTADMVAHPEDTAKNIGYAVSHPGVTAKSISNRTVTAFEENPAEALGEGIFIVGSALAPEALIGSVAKDTAEASEVGAQESKAAENLEAQNLAKSKNGLTAAAGEKGQQPMLGQPPIKDDLGDDKIVPSMAESGLDGSDVKNVKDVGPAGLDSSSNINVINDNEEIPLGPATEMRSKSKSIDDNPSSPHGEPTNENNLGVAVAGAELGLAFSEVPNIAPIAGK